MAVIIGRDEELAALDRFLERPLPAALLIEGEAGIGKTVLWKEGIRRAEERGRRALVASPVESEQQLPYAALGDLLGDASGDVVDRLPQPQRRALGVALLLDEPESTPPDRRAVAIAVLTALRLLATGATLLLAIDDVQLLDADSASVFEFVFRRLGDASIALLVARRRVREGEPPPLALDRGAMPVERMDVQGLSLGATGALLGEQLGASFRRPTLRRIHESSGGNPLFALGLARTLVGEGRDAANGELLLPRSLLEVVQERLAPLPSETASALLAVAALSDPTRTSLELALGPDWQEPLRVAVELGVVEVSAQRVRFTHPLLRSVLYADASAEERRALHHALSLLDLPLEERARHLAVSAQSPDEGTAAVLEEAARSAAQRGAPGAAAELASRAVALSDPTEEEGVRRRRYLAAGEYWGAGDVEQARAEVEAIVAEAPPGRVRSEALLRLAKNPRDMLESLELCERALAEAGDDHELRCDIFLFRFPLDFVTSGVEAARLTLDQAIDAAVLARDDTKRAHAEVFGAYLDWGEGRRFDRAALDRAAEVDRARPNVRLSLEERALYIRAVILSRACELDEARASWLALQQIALETGDEPAHADILGGLGRIEHLAGNWREASDYYDAAVELAEQTGLEHVLATNLADRALHDAMRGRLDRARADAERILDVAGRTHEPLVVGRGHHALALIAQARDDGADALTHIRGALAGADEMGVRGYADRPLAAGVDVALAQGDMETAEELTARLEHLASQTGLSVHRLYAQRGRGRILSARGDNQGALAALHEAVAAAECVPVPLERGQTLLALGEAQRRARQRRAARATIQAALQIFESLGAPLWVERARGELARIGGRAGSADELTPTEERVAALVAEGKTNKEVAAELVVSVRAVEANLSRIYGKLGIRSRAELARHYAEQSSD